MTPWICRTFSLHRIQGILSGSLQWSSKRHCMRYRRSLLFFTRRETADNIAWFYNSCLKFQTKLLLSEVTLTYLSPIKKIIICITKIIINIHIPLRLLVTWSAFSHLFALFFAKLYNLFQQFSTATALENVWGSRRPEYLQAFQSNTVPKQYRWLPWPVERTGIGFSSVHLQALAHADSIGS